MKPLFILIILISFASVCFADEWVNGYWRSNGTYVSGHYRSSPNSTVEDNYSHQGNLNPYTNEVGHNNSYGGNSPLQIQKVEPLPMMPLINTNR